MSLLSYLNKTINSTLFGKEYGIFSNPSGAWDRFKNGETNVVNKQIAQQNIDYQNAYNEQIFNREDTALQRGVLDARAAGLSALQASALGSGGSASAPQNNMQYQDRSNLSAIGDIGSIFNTVSSIFGQKASIDHLNAQTDSLVMDNKLKELTFNERLSDMMNTFSKNQLDFLNTRNRYNYEQANGFAPGMSLDERMMTMISNTFGIPTFSLGEKFGDFNATDYSSIGDSLKNVIEEQLNSGDSSKKEQGAIKRTIADIISGYTGNKKLGSIGSTLFTSDFFNPSYPLIRFFSKKDFFNPTKGIYNGLKKAGDKAKNSLKDFKNPRGSNNHIYMDSKGRPYYKTSDHGRYYLD